MLWGQGTVGSLRSLLFSKDWSAVRQGKAAEVKEMINILGSPETKPRRGLRAVEPPCERDRFVIWALCTVPWQRDPPAKDEFNISTFRV